MSTSIIILLPVILLGIVGMLCFVGCILDTSGLGGPPFTMYTGTTILLNPAIIGYWPLGEATDTNPAVDLISGNNGNYIDPVTTPPLYPWPAYTLPNPPGPDVESADAPGTIAFAQHGIVQGDTVQPANDPASVTPCVVVNGGYVEVPFNAKFSPATSFTVEAWARVAWDADATHAYRFVLDMRDFNPCTGFAIFAKAEDNQPGVYSWGGIIGNGGSDSAGFTLAGGVTDPPITLSDAEIPAGITYYLALTYDGPSQTLIFYVDGEQRGPKVTPVAYAPNTTQPLWIGAGAPYVPRRPQPAGVVASPLFPFVGAIQDVAIYNAALTSDDILLHYHNGNGINP
jgi:hypothetical protein